MDNLHQTILHLWHGKAPLWVAFWVWGQGVFALLLAAYIGMYKYSFDLLGPLRDKFAADTSLLAKTITALATVVNLVDLAGIIVITGFFTVVIWRCAPNTEWWLWTYLARGYMIVFWAFVALGAYWIYQQRGV